LTHNFSGRLQTELQESVRRRQSRSADIHGKRSIPIVVKVHTQSNRELQKFAAWIGGSELASRADFHTLCLTKQQYEEVGPSIVRKFRMDDPTYAGYVLRKVC